MAHLGQILPWQARRATTYVPTAMELAIAALSPNEWAEFEIDGLAAAFTNSGGSTGLYSPYSSLMPFDPVRRRAFFLGSDHALDIEILTLHHIVIDFWTSVATYSTPPWYTPDP